MYTVIHTWYVAGSMCICITTDRLLFILYKTAGTAKGAACHSVGIAHVRIFSLEVSRDSKDAATRN